MVPTGKHRAVLPDRLEGTCGTPPWAAWRNRRSTGTCTTARRPATQCVATSAAAAMRTARSANRPGRRCGILGGPSTTGLGSTSVRSWCGLAAASRTTDGQFLPCSDSFTIRSCRGRWCTTRGTPAPMGGQHADPAVLGGLQFCPEGGGFVVLGRESRQRHGAKSLQLGGLGVEPAEWAEPLDAVTSAVKTAPLILVGFNGEPHVSAWPGLAGSSEAPSTSTAFTG